MAEEPVFFIDRSLGRRHVAQALRAAGAVVEIHDDHFPQDAPTRSGSLRWQSEEEVPDNHGGSIHRQGLP